MISIIVPTFNRARSLIPALQSFAAQDFPIDQFEILIVDNGSTDATRLASEQFISQHSSHQIRYIYEPEPGLLAGRHRGALEARGAILTFADDDIEADAYWLQAIEESFSDPSSQLVGGRNLPRYEVKPPAWLQWFWHDHPYGRYCGDLSLLDFGDRVREIDADYIWGLNFSIRRQALSALGGFHPDLLPKRLQHFQGDGETGLTMKAKRSGYKAIYQPRALIFHQIPQERMNYDYFDARSFYQGVCDSYTDVRARCGRLKETSPKDRVEELIGQIAKYSWKSLRRQPSRLSERSILEQRFRQAFSKGYEFHQAAIRKNPQLLDWVLRQDYWDYKLPRIDVNVS